VIIDEEREDIDRAANTIVIGRNSVRGVSRLIYWPISNQQPKQVYAHIIFNAIKASKTKEDLYAHVSMLAKDAELRCKAEYKSDVKKYLSPVSAEVSESRYTINEAALKKELATAGWLVLISNYVETCEEALRIYRAKDVVEKGFMRLKNSLGLSRLRVHTHERTQAKVFVGFLSLILVAYIDRIMFEKDLFKSMTMKEMLFSLKKLRVQYINQHRILFPISKVQKSIFDAFDIVYPV